MAVASNRARPTNHLHNLQIPQTIFTNNNNNNNKSPSNITDHTNINPCITHNNPTLMTVPVVYYLSRNGLLDHPHFILVPLSSSHGLFLRDVINRLNVLRGKGMPSLYSWSSKRSYKNGYVWQDLGENDFIHPVHGGEYVLKGSQILQLPSPSSSSSSSLPKSPETTSFSTSSPKVKRNQSFDFQEYTVYKSESTPALTEKAASDASTQTDEKRRRRSRKNEQEEKEKVDELSRDEISPPPSDSSPETLETLMKADGRLLLGSSSSQAVNQSDHNDVVDRTVRDSPSGRMRASSVLMSLLSCGSISFRDCGVTAIKDHGFSLVSHQKMRLPRGENQTGEINSDNNNDVMMEVENNASRSFAKMALEDKEYFSGSLIETKKDEFPALKRSSSYNADRSSRLRLMEKEDGVKAKCIPRRPKMQTGGSKKECQAQVTSVTINSTQNGNQN